jgi:phytoene synthase
MSARDDMPMQAPRDAAQDGRDLLACKALLRDGSRTFLAASHLLPRDTRDAACALYAFCRLADDAVDLGSDATAAVAQLRARLDAIYAGQPHPIAADRALAVVARRHELPRGLLDGLIEGFEWDAQRRRYASLDEVLAYAARVAGAVGAMMAVLMGVRDRPTLQAACDLGVAMQLSNIARDVGEDARAGRLYLPLSWLQEQGIDPETWLANPQFDARIGAVVQRLLRLADELYARGDAGIAALPRGCQIGVLAASRLYAEIGRQVARNRYDSVASRAVVSGRRKLQVLGNAWVAGLAAPLGGASPAAPQTAFLLDAVPPRQHRYLRARLVPWWRLRTRALRMLDIVEQLETRKFVRRQDLSR